MDNKNILNYVLDNGKNITLTEAERKMLVQMFRMIIDCLEQMKQQPNQHLRTGSISSDRKGAERW